MRLTLSDFKRWGSKGGKKRLKLYGKDQLKEQARRGAATRKANKRRNGA